MTTKENTGMTDFERALSLAIQGAIDKAATEEIPKCLETVERRVRNSIGEIATNITSQLSFERFGPDIRITVRFPEKVPS